MIEAMRPPIPTSLDEIDAAWLTRALQRKYPGVNVGRIDVDTIVHGAGTKVRFNVVFERNANPPLNTTVWLKAGWEPHSEWLAQTSRIYAREAWFYRDLQPPIAINAPQAFYADFDDRGRGIVVLEDLIQRRATLNDCTVAASAEQIHRSLDALARLHAYQWDNAFLDATPLIDLPMRVDHPSSEWPRRNGPEVIAKFLATARGAEVPPEVNDPERIDRAFWVHIDHMARDRPHCLIHGDPHPGNGFVDADGSPGFFDWQTIAKGPWAFDVAYHIVSSMDVEERRRSERALLQHYLGRLRAYGVGAPPSFDEAWLQYRRYIAYGLHIWISNPVHFQAEENCKALVTRLSIAAADLKFFDAWGV